MHAPRLPLVAIVGRPNVGKSTFLNAAAGRRVSIVDAVAGTTRDRVTVPVEHRGVHFELVDTGGITDPSGSPMDAAVRRQVEQALARADAILFLVEARDGLLPVDAQIAEMLRRTGRPVVLGVNKVDSARHETALAEFYRLGFGDPVPLSAVQKLGVTDLLDRVAAVLPARPAAAAGTKPALPPMKLAIVGKQNVGKSTLVNALAGEERVIVSEVPGTTRDSVDVEFAWKGRTFVAIDTAGLRKKGKIAEPVEYYSRVRTEASIARADVVLFLIDARMQVSEVDKKIASYVDAHAKPCVIGINKYDEVEAWKKEKGKSVGLDEYAKYVARTLPVLHYAPLCLLSALYKKNIFAPVATALDLYRQAHERIPTSRINALVRQSLEWAGPRSRGRKKAKIYYATQTGVAPPTIVLFVNEPALFTDDYRRYLVTKFRDEMKFSEIPIRLHFQAHQRGPGKEMRAGAARRTEEGEGRTQVP